MQSSTTHASAEHKEATQSEPKPQQPSAPLSSAQQQWNSQIPQEEKDAFTIGTEQVVLSLALILLSLILLFRSSHSSAAKARYRDPSQSGTYNQRNSASTPRFQQYWNDVCRKVMVNSPMRRVRIFLQNCFYKNTSGQNSNNPYTGSNQNRSRLSRWYQNRDAGSKSDVGTAASPRIPLRKSKSTPLCTGYLRSVLPTDSEHSGGMGTDDQAIFLDDDNVSVHVTQSLGQSQSSQMHPTDATTTGIGTNADHSNDSITHTDTIRDLLNISPNIPDADEFYTDHERFTNAYNTTIRFSEYRRLVLPPECKLLDPSKIHSIPYDISSQALSTRIKEISTKCVDMIHNILSFDYVGYLVIFNLRILKAVGERVRKWLGIPLSEKDGEEDGDVEDDDTVASAGSRRSLMSRGDGSVSVSASATGSCSVTGNGVGRQHPYQQGYNSALSSPTGQSKSIMDSVEKHANHDAASTLSTIPTAALSADGSILHNVDVLCQDGGSVGAGSHASLTTKQRERFYTSDDHHLDSRDYGYDPTKSPLRGCRGSPINGRSANRSPMPMNRRPMASVYDDSFETSSMHSIGALSEDNDSQMWIPSSSASIGSFSVSGLGPQHDTERIGNLSGLNASPMRQISDEKKDHEGGQSTIFPLPSAMDRHDSAQTLKSKNKTLDSLAIPNLPPVLPIRPGQVKRKDTLEKYRNASTKSVIQSQSQPNSGNSAGLSSLIAPAEKQKLVERQQTHELQYFDTATNDASIRQIERAAPLPDREGYILGDQFLEDSRDTPLLVFVNTRSGSQQGFILKMQLRSLLNPIQIWDLADGGPEKILKSFSVLTRLRLLVCGGDGTVSWIISALDKMNIERWPPIAILPLGTGNDLARIHGWGAGYANESLLMILDQVKESYISLLDRWNLTIEEKKKKSKDSKSKKAVTKPFINYMSIGMDAVSALQVHNLRENSPEMFFSRAINKFWYTIFGAEDAIKASCSDLPQQIILEADGVRIPIPKDSQGLIILNIDSYLGGVPLWSRGVPIWQKKNSRRERRYSEGDFSFRDVSDFELTSKSKRRGKSFGDGEISLTAEEEYNEETMEEKIERIMSCTNPSSCQDGKVDIISHKGNFNLGQIRVGLTNAQRLCQCSKVKIILKKGTSVQIDGEPWKQAAGVLKIERQKDPAVMLHRALEEGGGIETEVANLLEWAEEKNIIERDAHASLMKEFSRRIEKKTRERRNKSEQNVFATMKRRIASSHRFPVGSDYE